MTLGGAEKTDLFKRVIGYYSFYIREEVTSFERIWAEAKVLAASLPPPSYTAIDRSRGLIRELAGQHASNPFFGSILSPANVDPILTDPLDLPAIDQAFGRLVVGAFGVSSQEETPFETLKTICRAYQLFAGGVFLIPDQLIPPLLLISGMQGSLDVGLIDAEFNANELVTHVHIGRNTEPEEMLETIRHELLHLIQHITGIQSGNILRRGFTVPIRIGAVMLYFPSLVPEDAVFPGITDLQARSLQHMLLEQYKKLSAIFDLTSKLETADLNKIAAALDVAPSENNTITAARIYEAISNDCVYDWASFKSALKRKGLPQNLISHLLPIAKTKADNNITNPKEVEAAFLEEPGLVIGNPSIILQAGSQRGLIQLPFQGRQRTRLYSALSDAAMVRRTELSHGIGYDLRGGRVIDDATSAVKRWVDPASPRYCDVRDLRRTVKRSISEIAERAAQAGRDMAGRVEFR